MSFPRARGRRAQPSGAMNQTEIAYARHLDALRTAGEIAWFRWEPMKLRLGKNWKTSYCPDFMVMGVDGLIEFHEVKGHWEDDARVKIKVAARLFPMYKFIAIKKGRVGESSWKVEEF